MKTSEFKELTTQVEMIKRDLDLTMDRLSRKIGTQFEPNITETKSIKAKIKTIRRKASDLTQV